MIKYADDVICLIPFYKADSISTIVKSETHNIKRWCLENGLALNEGKTKVLLFSKRSVCDDLLLSSPPLVSSAKILGVTFNQRLNWNNHVAAIVKSASRRIYILKQMKKISSVTKKDLLQVYKSFVLSVIEYNSPLFTNFTEANKQTLEKIQRRSHKIICGLNCECTDFPTLSDRRSLQIDKVFSRILSQEHILHHLLPHKLPRTQHFFIEHLRSDLRARSFIPFCCTRWNSFQIK